MANLKIIRLDHIVYDVSFRGYVLEDIFFAVDEIACVQEYCDRAIKEQYRDSCQVWLKGNGESFLVKGSAKEVVQKMEEVANG